MKCMRFLMVAALIGAARVSKRCFANLLQGDFEV
jgi:hypothetical protein